MSDGRNGFDFMPSFPNEKAIKVPKTVHEIEQLMLSIDRRANDEATAYMRKLTGLPNWPDRTEKVIAHGKILGHKNS